MTKASQLLEDSMRASIPDARRTFAISVPKADIRPRSAALTGALVPSGDGTFDFRGYRLTGIGLENRDGGSEADWAELGGVLRALEGSLQWLIGDWIVAGELRWGKTYEEICELTGYEYQTVRDYAYVARNVDLSIRIDKLSHAHHRLVASMPQDSQREWLGYALGNRLSVAKLRAEIREAQAQLLAVNNSQNYSVADSPTAADGGLWAENGQNSGLIMPVITESTAPMVQMSLWDKSELRDFDRRATRLKNVVGGQLTMTRDELLAEVAAARKLLDALERKARGG